MTLGDDDTVFPGRSGFHIAIRPIQRARSVAAEREYDHTLGKRFSTASDYVSIKSFARFLSEVVARADAATLTSELERKYPSASDSTFWTPTRVQLLRAIAHAVQQRSSALIAAACVGLLDCVGDIQIDPNHGQQQQTMNGTTPSNPTDTPPAAQHQLGDVEELVIAYAGGTISQYPHWLSTCQRWIDALVTRASPQNRGKKVVLREALDGGIVGAVLQFDAVCSPPWSWVGSVHCHEVASQNKPSRRPMAATWNLRKRLRVGIVSVCDCVCDSCSVRGRRGVFASICQS